MGKISLKGLHFKAYHGYYDEERERGNQFEVDISVNTDFEKASAGDDLIGTVDYEQLYTIVKEEMTVSSKLLENVIKRITNRVLKDIPAVKSVKVSLSKSHPPIGGDCRAATVSLKVNRKDSNNRQ